MQSEGILFFSKYRREATDLCAEGSSDMLRTIRDQVFHARHDLVKKDLPVDQTTES